MIKQIPKTRQAKSSRICYGAFAILHECESRAWTFKKHACYDTFTNENKVPAYLLAITFDLQNPTPAFVMASSNVNDKIEMETLLHLDPKTQKLEQHFWL